MSTVDSALLDRLRQAAAETARHAYAPYSKFHVGAALLFDDGSVVTGCNVENASYGLSCCAERNALFRAITEHGPGRRIRAIAVANRNSTASAPCGACRQVLAEFAAPDAVVTFPGDHGPQTMLFSDIFPSAFTFAPGPKQDA